MKTATALLATVVATAALASTTAIADSAKPSAHHGKTIHVTAVVTKSFRSRGTPTIRVALDLFSGRTKVGTTKSALTCDGLGITFVGCYGGPVTLKGVGFRFFINHMLWSVPLCATGKNCKQGDRSAKGDILKGSAASLKPPVGSITVGTTASGFSTLHHRFAVTVHLN